MRPFLFALLPPLVFALACTGVAEEAPAEPEIEQPTPERRPGRGAQRPDRPERPGGDGAVGEAPPASPSPAPSPEPTPGPSGITQVASDTWEVKRALVNKWEEDPSRLGNAVQDGKGWRLVRIKGKDAWHLGMKNGDVLLDVNGYPLGSTAELMLAWAQLQRETELSVRFRRDGATMKHQYRIR